MEERKPYGVKKEMKNNDRFKFRAWDKSFHKYCENVIVSTINNEITVYGRLVGGRTALIPDSHVELEQCTGLYDCNGKLIYEGDIIRTEIETDNEYKQIIGEIVFWRLEWTIKTKRVFYPLSCAGKFSNGIKMPKQCDLTEVIGNIHENPELLEG